MGSRRLLILCALFALTFGTTCEDGGKPVTLFANGELKKGFQDFVPSKTFEQVIGQFRQASVYGKPQVYNQLGVRLRSYEEIQSGDQLFVVAHNLLFVWPSDRNHTLDPSRFPPEAAVLSSTTLEPVSNSPRIFRIADFMSPEEADQFVQQAESSGNLTHSILGVNGARSSRIRTSDSYFDRDTPLAKRLVARALRMLGLDGNIPDQQHEGLQVLRYQPGQAFVPHTDFFPPADFPHVPLDPAVGSGSNRFATFFIYLNDVPDEAGGKTAFVTLPPLPGQYSNTEAQLEAAKLAGNELALAVECNQHAAFKPQRGEAILFYSQTGNGKLDHASKHAGCPLLSGVKYAANLWVWNAPQHKRLREPKPRPFVISNELTKWTGPRREMTWDEEPEDLRPPVIVLKNGELAIKIDTKGFKMVSGYSDDRWTVYREGQADRPFLEWTQKPEDAGTTVRLRDPED